MSRFLCLVGMLTLTGLFYVYEEVEAVKIGYHIRLQQETKVRALDHTRALKYNIARLTAPQNLEKKLLAQHIQLESPKAWQTLILPGGVSAGRPVATASAVQRAPLFSRFLIGTAQAEAKEA